MRIDFRSVQVRIDPLKDFFGHSVFEHLRLNMNLSPIHIKHFD